MGFSGFALEIENRALLPTGARSPAEAGLESGRYEEIPLEGLEAWERRRESSEIQNQVPASNEAAKVESNFQKAVPTR